jgi:hypothetical protein
MTAAWRLASVANPKNPAVLLNQMADDEAMSFREADRVVHNRDACHRIRALQLAAELIAHSTWISVCDQMPDVDLSVLIHNTDPNFSEPVWIGYHDGECWRSAAGDSIGPVTHWRNLPEPPPARTRPARDAK